MFFTDKVSQFSRWIGGGKSIATLSTACESARRTRPRFKCNRKALLELMEPRHLMAADPIQIGAVYVEEDLGSDLHGDLFYVSFDGGAAGTTLERLEINGDLNEPGFGLGDLFFDTVESGLGADHAYAFKIEQLITANPNARVTATVVDGTSLLVLDFVNFQAGDLLVFSIDVDEVQSYDASETDLQVLNDGFDPITSGVEFQNSKLTAQFSAPHYEVVDGSDKFLNRYDARLDPFGLNIPRDNDGGKRDRSAGAGIELQQVPKPVSLAGIVYVDANEDLRLQTSEQRLGNVRLDLYRLEGAVYVNTGHSTTTDSQGRYEFGTNLGLQPGTYQVRQRQPEGYYSVGATPGFLGSQMVGATVPGNPDMLTQVELLLGDSHATQLNFAENLPASISGHVCYVISGFDCFSSDSEKAPLEGVTIELRNATGQIIATTTTAVDGSYKFDNLRAGTYSLTEITPAGYLEGDAKVGSAGGVRSNGSLISQITIGGGVDATGYDFCELPPSELSGHTYFDANNNGRRDTGETPLSGVTIVLWDAAGSRVAETTTNAQGFYQFTNLRPGEYRITETTPDGYLPGQADVGTIAGTRVGSKDASGDVIGSILLPAAAKGINYDFGEILPGSISGRVISDINGNCIIDIAGEMPLPGVVIELLDANGSIVASTTTDSNGEYEFDGIVPGTYAVREVQPAGYFQGDQKAGSGGGDDSTTDLIRSIAVGPGVSLVDYNFCEIPPASIGGTVYVDSDQDCVFDDGEAPIAGVTIALLDSNGDVVATTTTDSQGNYQFNNLRPGTYSIRESQPTGYFQGGQVAGSGGGDDSAPDIISAIDIRPGADLVDYDFCELLPGSISGLVFADLDGDCFFDVGEQRLSGVRIELLDSSGNVVATTFTDSNGRYEFTGLEQGRYAVRETQPAGFFQGGQRAGSGGGDASVDDLISGIDLVAGVDLVDYDFCEVLPGSIAGMVFADLDFDCVQDAGESSLADVRVDLLDASGNVIESTVTDSNGRYSFTNLRPGTYSVREHQPLGYFQGGQVAPATGGDDSVDDLISGIEVGSGQHITDANFCEVPPAELSGFVFQDGPVITTTNGVLPEDMRTLRDGQRTADDTPIGGVVLQLRLVTGAQAPSSIALPGTYTGEFIEVVTDANGFFSFTGLRAGFYHVFQLQPENYADSLDTPGTTTGLTLNSRSEIDQFFDGASSFANGLRTQSTAQLLDAVLGISLEPGQVSRENNFSEVVVRTVPPTPPIPEPPNNYERPLVGMPYFAPNQPLAWSPLTWNPQPLIVGVGHEAPQTWHLSVINGGFPRGARNGEPLDEEVIADNADRLDNYEWTVRGLESSTWRFVSSQNKLVSSPRMVFDIPGAQPLAGDFNGDGYDELALFLDGEWFIDINGNGRWDEADIWLKLGSKGDQPVVGDWDRDGKDDVGIFGKKWQGDERAIAYEPGLPDPENMVRVRPKNLPPSAENAPDDPRLLKRSRGGQARADLIDHVFRFGSARDTAISGDFNGDGISTIGVYRNGEWTMDVNGDGRLTEEHDAHVKFGQPGDLPLVGDFDNDGIDEIAIVRGNEVIVDSNGNGRIDATDQVFMLDDEDGTVIAGDFDGDGFDEPALHQNANQRRTLQARRVD